MSSAEQALLTLATEQFLGLTKAEKILLSASATGCIADYRMPKGADNDPGHAETWHNLRTIRATVIRWLCVNHEAIRYIDPKGLQVNAARIDGELNLEAVIVPFPLHLTRCAIYDGVALSLAKTHTLNFDGSFIGDLHRFTLLNGNSYSFALQADGVTVDGVVSLCEGFRAEGGVCLTGARITRNLACRKGTVWNPGTIALQLSGITVGGDVFLREGFQAQGEVQLIGASITGDLDCDGGIFYNPLGTALNAARMTVGGALLLRAGFQAEGRVRLIGSKVSVLTDDKDSWPASGNLELDHFVYTTADPIDAEARLAWLERQPSTPFRPQPYLQLAKVLRESGREADAKWVLIVKERTRRKHGGLGWGARYANWLLDVTIGYGYRPWLAGFWAALWVVVGGMLFGMGYQKEIVIPTKAEAYNTDKQTKQETAFYPAFNRWVYAFDTFVPITNLRYGNDSPETGPLVTLAKNPAQ